MNTRTKILAAALVVLIAGWQIGMPFFRSTFLAPLDERELVQQDVMKKREQADLADLRLLTAARQLKDWEQISLPSDPLEAQNQYMEWITQLARLSGFRADDSLKVKPGPNPSRKEAYTSVIVELEGEATFENLCKFLYHFHRTNLLHRILSVDIESPGSEGNPELTVSIEAEGLSLPDADPSRLFPRVRLQEALGDTDTELLIDGPAKDFPVQELPFRICAGTELLEVIDAADDRWTVVRGVDHTTPEDHDSGSMLELAPLRHVRTTLLTPLAADGETIRIKEAPEFPTQSGFRVRIGNELLRVEAITGTEWTVTRGLQETEAAAHAAQSTVLLEVSYEEYVEELARQNLFTKPAPEREYAPRLIAEDQRFLRGSELDFQIAVEDFNPALGALRYDLTGEVPEGMTIDHENGTVHWSPPEDTATGEYELAVAVRQGDAAEPLLAGDVQINYAEPNEPPRVTIADSFETFIGQPLEFVVAVEDPDNDSVRVTLENGPGTARVDETTGRFQWTPGLETAPGAYELTFDVTDTGTPPETVTKTVQVMVEVDTAQFTVFVASIERDGKPEAWFYDRANNRKLVVREGETFSVGTVRGRVVRIEPERVLLEAYDQTYAIELGANLRSMVPVSAAE